MSPPTKKNSRLLYSKETLKEALAAIKAGMPINTASNKYHIPRSTLHNKKTAKYADKRPGPETVLTTVEEQSLVQWIFHCNKQGMTVGKQQLLNSVALVVKTLNRENPFANGRPGRHWYQGFLRRHSIVQDKINENLTTSRIPACEMGIRNWFFNLKLSLEEKNLLNIHPSRIFTTETGMLSSPDGSEEKENLCINLAGNAAGQLAPPMILFTYQRIPGKIYEKLPKGWICSKSENGCMTAENLYEYVTKSFHPWLIENKIEFPVILFIDGRALHLTLLLTDFCLRNRIELVALHPNSSHLLQPLEVAMFPSLKVAWQEALTNYRSESKAVNLLKECVAPQLESVFNTLNITVILTNGFKACGLYPLSENAINYEKIPKKVVEKSKTDRVEFTTFMPELLPTSVKEATMNYVYLFQLLEEMIDVDTMQAFKNVNESHEWIGRIEDTSLFYIWRRISNICKRSSYICDFTCQQNAIAGKYETIHGNVETDIIPILIDSKEDINLIIDDPLKICETEMKDV